MASGDRWVLDTSAVFCLKDNASGADKVEEILEKSKSKHAHAYISFMTMMEYLYIFLMKYGDELAHRAYLELTLLPISIVESNEDLRFLAAQLKANHNISVADAWIAATAVKMDAILVHKDPEFESVKHLVKCLSLPYKK